MSADTTRVRDHLHVATYNVHRCMGADGQRDVDRVARVLLELDADVVGLQEIDARSAHAVTSAQLSQLTEATGFHAFADPLLQRIDGTTGNALLTRWPLSQVQRIDLSQPGREPRAAIMADLHCGETACRLVVTHLGLNGAERRRQVHSLMAAITPFPPLTVLLADINEWWPLGRALATLHQRFGRAPAVPSFPAQWPLLALDRVWTRPRQALRRIHAHRSRLARTASDHLPVCGQIEAGTAAL